MLCSSPLQKPMLAGKDQSAYLRIPGYKNRLTVDQIVWVQGDGNYCRIHLVNGRQIMISQTLKVMEGILPQLTRIHKSSMVNPGHVQDIHTLPGHHTGSVRLTGGVELSVARRRLDGVMALFRQPQMA
ncbi:hypothetical protein F5984_00160 [Rudanella paleaurantiibacter]|uniref:HTH LytTR-type domain-containing protein n=1 Tax=Rudanella paleaurantiibacter TaxID=2614655 RepID=A0A7J5U3T9_9BACT|nr:LytTR family DNA-binding domain-containing protein [Rudanella paleaurantiibacter]KAB7732416.1 hypothetical protein F5984_00160 [Rudanella paleaurantiibacter]